MMKFSPNLQFFFWMSSLIYAIQKYPIMSFYQNQLTLCHTSAGYIWCCSAENILLSKDFMLFHNPYLA